MVEEVKSNASKMYERHRTSEIQIQIANRHIKQVSHLSHENDDILCFGSTDGSNIETDVTQLNRTGSV